MRVAVIGGGLAGLSCVLELTDAGADVVLLEAGDRFGGQVRTTRERGYLVEEGADGFDPEDGEVRALVEHLRLADGLLTPQQLPTLVLERANGKRALAVGAAAEPAVPALTLRAGMGALARAIARRVEGRADLRVGTAAVALGRTADGWTVYPESGPALTATAIVLAMPPRAAAWLLHPVSAPAARSLAQLGGRAMIVVSLAYRRADVSHPLNAAGFAVPRGQGEEGLELCTFVTSSFDARAPGDAVLLRARLRPARGELAGTSDEGWARVAHEALSPVLGLRAGPIAAWVARWMDAVPARTEAYRARVTDARRALGEVGRAEFAGAAYDLPGLDGALRSGRDAARRVTAT